MSEKVRCKCGAQFGARDLSGNPRAACPVCRAPVDALVVATAASPPKRPAPSPRTASREVPPAAKPIPAPLPVTKPRLPELVKNWIPPNLLRNHDGVKPWNSRKYLWGPPPEIGEILSVDSNVLESGRPSFIIRYLGAISIAVATYFVLMSGILIPVRGDLGILSVIAAGLSLVLGGGGYFGYGRRGRAAPTWAPTGQPI